MDEKSRDVAMIAAPRAGSRRWRKVLLSTPSSAAARQFDFG